MWCQREIIQIHMDMSIVEGLVYSPTALHLGDLINLEDMAMT